MTELSRGSSQSDFFKLYLPAVTAPHRFGLHGAIDIFHQLLDARTVVGHDAAADWSALEAMHSLADRLRGQCAREIVEPVIVSALSGTVAVSGDCVGNLPIRSGFASLNQYEFIGKTLVPDDDAAFRWRDERASEIDAIATSAHAAQEQRANDEHVRAG